MPEHDAYYNDFDASCVSWLDLLIKDGMITAGPVDSRSIKDLTVEDFAGANHVHLFAGVGGWDLAIRLSDLPGETRILTGSCPCQPFSSAGKRKGIEDDRHLWPDMFRLVREADFPYIAGEQVASKDGRLWFEGVRMDLESAGYAVAAADIPAAAVGLPHIRQRLYWFAVKDAGITSLELTERLATELKSELRSLEWAPEYQYAWKTWPTSGNGPPIIALRASNKKGVTVGDVCRWADTLAGTSCERPAGELAVEGWPTPNTCGRGPEDLRGKATRGSGGVDLQTAVLGVADAQPVSGWATPQASDHVEGRRTDIDSPQKCLGRDIKGLVHENGDIPFDTAGVCRCGTIVEGWVTPSARDHKDTPGMATRAENPDGTARLRVDQLPRQAAMVEGWQTPTSGTADAGAVSRSGARKHELLLGGQASASQGASSQPATEGSGKSGVVRRLNPAFSLWLMSFPAEWLYAAPAKRARGKKSKKTAPAT